MKWTVKLVVETEPGRCAEHEVAVFERPDRISPASLGLSIAEGKAILGALQGAMVEAQVTRDGHVFRACGRCSATLPTKGYYRSTFRSVYGNVPIRVRRLMSCQCDGEVPISFSTLNTGHNATSPELLYLTTKLAALMPFGKVASFLAEVLPGSTRTNACTIRNRTMRIGRRLEDDRQANEETPVARATDSEVFVALDGGYVKNRHPRPQRNFEVLVGKVLAPEAQAHRFAFVRRGTFDASEALRSTLGAHGIGPDTSVTVLSDGDAGLREVQKDVLPRSTHILDWFHIGMRFQQMGQIARGLASEDVDLRDAAVAKIERAKWYLWHGRHHKAVTHLTQVRQMSRHKGSAGVKMSRHIQENLRYLAFNADSLPNYRIRYHAGQPISSAIAESTVNEILSRRMVKHQQMRWNRQTVQPFLTARVHVLNNTLEEAFRGWHRAFRPVARPAAPLSS